MFDFSWSEHTLGNVLYSTILYALFVVFFIGRYVNRALSQSKKTNNVLMFAALLLIITACIDGDWFNYRNMVLEYDLSPGAFNYGEPVYYYIIQFVGKNYFLFRMVVWGGAFLLTLGLCKRMDVNINIAVFFIVAVFLIKFNYPRATLGMVSYFLGLSYLLKPMKKKFIFNILIAAVLMWSAYEFHHSMLLLIVLTPAVLVPMDKPFLAIAAMLLLPTIASFISSNFFLIDLTENEYIMEKMERNLEREGNAANIFGIIQNVLNYGVFVLPFVIDTMVVFKKRVEIPVPMLKIFNITISIAILSASFALMNLNSSVFVYRILYMSFIPLTLLTVYFYERKLMSKKSYLIIVLWGILTISSILLHLIYKFFK